MTSPLTAGLRSAEAACSFVQAGFMPGSRIGVVGCGVAGAAAAFLLAEAGHDVTLFERAEEVGPVGAGVLLQPSGQMVLDRLGLLEIVTRCAEPIERLRAITH